MHVFYVSLATTITTEATETFRPDNYRCCAFYSKYFKHTLCTSLQGLSTKTIFGHKTECRVYISVSHV